MDPHEIEKTRSRLELHEEVHIALRAIISSRNGTENGDAARMMIRRNSPDLTAPPLNHLQPGSHDDKPTECGDPA